MTPSLAAANLLGAWLLAAPPDSGEPASKPDLSDLQLEKSILPILEDLANERPKRALKALVALEGQASDPAPIRRIRGHAALVARRFAVARRLLDAASTDAVYRAMAEAHRDGGVSRARAILGRRVRKKNATPAEQFLAALAFHRVGESGQADRLLARAIAGADGALEDAFAPDPWTGLINAVRTALKEGSSDDALQVALAERLLRAGRRRAAVALVADIRRGPSASDAYRIRVHAWQKVRRREALRLAGLWAKSDPEAVSARVSQAELFLDKDDVAGAKRVAHDLVSDDPALSARIDRVQAQLALMSNRPEDALEFARRSARNAPKHADGVYWVARATLANGRPARAAEFAEVLLKRRPLNQDPFSLLADIRAAEGQDRKVAALRLRSRAFQADRKKITAKQRRRETVLSAVRDAEGGLGLASLRTLRADHPDLALPIDLALAGSSKRGTARAARDQILAACAPHFARFLTRTESWDTVSVAIAPYGQTQTLQAPLSAADPARCPGRQIRH